MVDLTVSIATTNHCQMVRDCLESIYGGTKSLSLEVFVIDSGSVDGTIAMLAKDFPQVKRIRNERFPGFSAVHNQALRQATGRHVMILNDDTLVEPGALDRIVSFLDAHPEVGAVGPYLVNRDGTHQISSYVGFPSLWSEIFTRAAPISWLWDRRRQSMPANRDYINHYGTYNGKPTEVRRVKHLMGACIAVPRSVLDSVGLLDEGFFLSYEDQDWCKRIDDAGKQVIYFPESRVVHFGNVTTRNVEHFGRIFIESRLRFQQKHFGRISAAIIRPLFSGIALVNKGWSKVLMFRRRLLSARSA
jgi:GT2 family glycosyltransferase